MYWTYHPTKVHSNHLIFSYDFLQLLGNLCLHNRPFVVPAVGSKPGQHSLCG
jgi:hypothetical protein